MQTMKITGHTPNATARAAKSMAGLAETLIAEYFDVDLSGVRFTVLKQARRSDGRKVAAFTDGQDIKVSWHDETIGTVDAPIMLGIILHEMIHIWQERSGVLDVVAKTWMGHAEPEYRISAREIHAEWAAAYITNAHENGGAANAEYFRPEHLTPEWALARSQQKQSVRHATQRR